MSTRPSSRERAIRIELARARAALERRNVAHSLCELRTDLTPAGLARGFMAGSRRLYGQGGGSHWLTQLLGLTRRYPLLISTASAVLGGAARRGLAWRIGLAALAGWKILQAMQVRPDATPSGRARGDSHSDSAG